MLRFKSPPEPPAQFAEDVREAEEKIQGIVKKRNPKSTDFSPVWGKYKGSFLAAQFDKCGYCEMPLPNHPGAVEHFRPKAGIEALPEDSADRGQEGIGDYSVIGRRLKDASPRGYWWRAYDWSNYLASCERCNTGWKRNLFPILEVPRQTPQPTKPETELLLNPFQGEDPTDHLEYDKIGQVTPRNGSVFGSATIQTCGLDRNSLVRFRAQIAPRVYRLLEEYKNAVELRKEDQQKAALEHFLELASEKSGLSFPGMVRAIFKQSLELSGDDWAAFVGQT